jgi:hypothetical protein
MLSQILQMLQIAQDYENSEVISIAKGKYQYTTNYKELFKKAMKWQSKK